MRTTITLDDDVYNKLKRRTKSTGWDFKKAVNELLRAALSSDREPTKAARFEFPIFNGKLGFRAGFNADMTASEMMAKLDEAEDAQILNQLRAKK